MFQIDPFSRVPVYEQIVEQTERFVLLGVALFFCHFDAPFQIKMCPCSGK